MATLASTVVDRALDELRDPDGALFSQSFLLSILWEVMAELERREAFVVRNYVIPLDANKDAYEMPSDFLKVSRLAYGKAGHYLAKMSTVERDRLGMSRYINGAPRKYFQDGLPMNYLGIWPIPNSDIEPDTDLVTPTDGDGKVYAIVPNTTDMTGHLILEYFSEASLPSPLTTHNGSSYSNDGNLDESFPDSLYREIYKGVCARALKGSKRAEHIIKSQMYEEEFYNLVIAETKRWRRGPGKRKRLSVR